LLHRPDDDPDVLLLPQVIALLLVRRSESSDEFADFLPTSKLIPFFGPSQPQ
jgi:hypothetical protein